MRKIGMSLMAASLAWLSAPAPSHAAQVFTTDLIVQGSECVGFDCSTGESFGADTIRLKENNLRIHFNDTSNSASFPSNDWRIIINDSANGGANYFAIEDSTAGNQPFRVDAGAGANALRIESGGNVGLGNSNPAVELHVTDGDTPTLRLEQNGSSGFTPQTFDVASNEANFFIRDVTNGSRLPFRIKPGSGNDDAIVIAANGDVGMGTDTPGAPLHARRTGSTFEMLRLEATDGSGMGIRMLDGSFGIDFNNTGNEFRVNVDTEAGAGAELRLASNGDLTVTGDVFSATCTSPGSPCAPDYVFEPDYELMPLDELAEFVSREKHLPNVPSGKELIGPISLNKLQMKLLEKIEELTLYTLAQEKTITELQARLAMLE